jgi:hypothetical protein
MVLTDAELQEMGLISLTEEHYQAIQQELLIRLRRINAMYIKLHSHIPLPGCLTLRKVFLKYTPVGPSDDITGDMLYQLYIDFAHLVARARQRSNRWTPIGGMVQHRLATDLKISKHRLLLNLIHDDVSKTSARGPGQSKSVRYENATSSKIVADADGVGAERDNAVYALELQFLYGKYCSIFQDEGIDVQDLDLIAQEFALHIPEADKRVVSDQLDPENTGFVYFVYFLRWMKSPTPSQFSDVSLRTKQQLSRLLQAATRRKYFTHAADVMVARFRAIARMEIAVREGILYSDEFRWDASLDLLLSFYRSCESGDVNRVVKARKYHLLDGVNGRSSNNMGFDDDGDDGFSQYDEEYQEGGMDEGPLQPEENQESGSNPPAAGHASSREQSLVPSVPSSRSPSRPSSAVRETPVQPSPLPASRPSSARQESLQVSAKGSRPTSAVPSTTSGPAGEESGAVPESRPDTFSRPSSAHAAAPGTPGKQPSPSPSRPTSARPLSGRRTRLSRPSSATAVGADGVTPMTPAEAAAAAALAITASVKSAQMGPAAMAAAAAAELQEAEGDFEADNEGSEVGLGAGAAALAEKNFVKPTIRGRVYDNLMKLYTLKWREEESEHRVIYGVVERRAERLYWRGLLTPMGWYNLLTERQFLRQLDDMVDAVGYCFVASKTGAGGADLLPFDANGGRMSMQQVLTANFGSSVSSLASGSLHNPNTVDLNTISYKSPTKMNMLLDNASVSSHTHSFAHNEDAGFNEEDMPFGYLNPQDDGPLSPSVASASNRGVGGYNVGFNVPGPQYSAVGNGPPSPEIGGGSVAGAGSSVVMAPSRKLPLASQSRSQNSAMSPDAASLYTTALEMTISVFDTDCTGDLDEAEVRVLLRCLRCALSEKAFRHVFADSDDVIRGVSLRKLVNHLRARVHWYRGGMLGVVLPNANGLSVSKAGHLRCAAGIQITLQRQLAHKRALQTVKLSKLGHINILRDANRGTSDQTLLIRAQLFAMRQVAAFLKTTQGRIKHHQAVLDVTYSYQHEVLAVCANPTYISLSGVYCLNYAFSIHHEGEGILITELPHVVKFLITRCGLQPTPQLESLSQMFASLRCAADIRTLSHAEFCALLTPLFYQPTKLAQNTCFSRIGRARRLRRDAKYHMYSCARQQAVKIAMDFPVIDVAETNYRCSVLGLQLFVQQNLSTLNLQQPLLMPPPATPQSNASQGNNTELSAQSLTASGAANAEAMEGVRNDPTAPSGADLTLPPPDGASPSSTAVPPAKRPTGLFSKLQKSEPAAPKTPRVVPMEAVSLYLLSLGYSKRDLSHNCFQELVDVEHLQGHFRVDPINLTVVKETARNEVAKPGTYLESFRRARRKALHHARYEWELRVTVRALVEYGPLVEKKGAELLKELLVGVSHCLE